MSISDLRTPAEAPLWKSAGILRHRGPHNWGIYLEPGIGLAHTDSLSLTSPEKRPAFLGSADRDGLVYNGEIYNFKELRTILIAEGFCFHTASDTEALLNAMIAWGVPEALTKLDGDVCSCLPRPGEAGGHHQQVPTRDKANLRD